MVAAVRERESAAQLIPGMPSTLPTSWVPPGLPAGIPGLPTTGGGGASLAPLFPRGLNFLPVDQYLKIAQAFAPSMGNLPPSADISADFPPVGTQQAQGSCVAWAVAYGLKSFQEHDERGWAYTTDHLFSPAYLFNSLKKGNCEGGLYVSEALDFVASNGVAPLSLMPYNSATCAQLPTPAAKEAASQFRVSSIKRIDNDPVEIKSFIATRTPVVVGMRLDTSFDYLKGGQIYMGATGPYTGGHAMVIVGYDDTRQAYRLFNSWGTSWGDKGFGWVSYSAFSKQGNEVYIAKSFHPPKTPDTPGPTPTPATPAKPEASPKATLSAPSTMKNILVGDTYYFGLAVAGTIDNAQNRKYQLVVRFRKDGQPIVTKDSKYSDTHGYLAAATPRQAVPSTKFSLSGAPSVAIPQMSLRNSLGASSGDKVDVEVYYDVYVDNFFVGRSPSSKMTFNWN